MPVSLRILVLDEEILGRTALQPLTWLPYNATPGNGVAEDEDGTLLLVQDHLLTPGKLSMVPIEKPLSTVRELRQLLRHLA